MVRNADLFWFSSTSHRKGCNRRCYFRGAIAACLGSTAHAAVTVLVVVIATVVDDGDSAAGGIIYGIVVI